MASHDFNSGNRDLNKFYDKIRLHLDKLEFDNLDDQSENSKLFRDLIDNVPPDRLHANIKKEDFEKILNAYDKQQLTPDQRDKSVKCDTVEGSSYEKLLYSRPGFHHLGSTAILIHELGIKDSGRYCFLGGLSDYTVNENISLKGLLLNKDRIIAYRCAQAANDLLKDRRYNQAWEEIDKAIKLNPTSGFVYDMRGRYYSSQNRHSEAVCDFKKALDLECPSREEVLMRLSDALYSHGMHYFHRNDYKGAMAKFKEALEHNRNNQGAIIHMGICDNRLRMATPFSNKPLTYRK